MEERDRGCCCNDCCYQKRNFDIDRKGGVTFKPGHSPSFRRPLHDCESLAINTRMVVGVGSRRRIARLAADIDMLDAHLVEMQ
jgi:hypothetical protein